MSGDGMCVYGHTGSRVAACDRDATTTRDGFEYCDAHADWIDWAKSHQLDEVEK